MAVAMLTSACFAQGGPGAALKTGPAASQSKAAGKAQASGPQAKTSEDKTSESNGSKTSKKSGKSAIRIAPRRVQNFLGLRVGTIPAALKAQMPSLDNVNHGMIVLAVIKDSPAENAGLKKHDIVLSVDKQPLKSTAQLQKIVSSKAARGQVKFAVLRQAQALQFTATLGQRTTSAAPRKIAGPADEGPGAALVSAGHKLPKFYTSVRLTPIADEVFDLEIRTRDGVAPESILNLSGTMPELRKAVAKEKRLVLSNVVFCLNFFGEPANRSRMRFKVTPHFVAGWKFVRVTMVRKVKDGTYSLYALDKRVIDNGTPPLADVMQIKSFKSQLSELDPRFRRPIEQSIKNYNSLTSQRANPARKPSVPGGPKQGDL